jgi:hypothetical protein
VSPRQVHDTFGKIDVEIHRSPVAGVLTQSQSVVPRCRPDLSFVIYCGRAAKPLALISGGCLVGQFNALPSQPCFSASQRHDARSRESCVMTRLLALTHSSTHNGFDDLLLRYNDRWDINGYHPDQQVYRVDTINVQISDSQING